MTNSLISIILPVYNGEKYLSQSIESCLNQTYGNIELIVVNDCSTDETLNIVKSFQAKDSRVKIITNSENKRLPASLNIGHQCALGDLMTWTSDDNLYLPNAIEKMVNSINSYQADFVYADYIQIDENGDERRNFYFDEPEALIWRNVVGACFLYKKEVFAKNKGYNEALFMVEDYDFWLRTFFEFKMKHIPEVLYKYRVHSESLTAAIRNQNSEKQKIFEENKIKMYEFVFDKYNFPLGLKQLVLQHQQQYYLDKKMLISQLKEIKSFFKQHFFETKSYYFLMYYTFKHYLSTSRNHSETQGLKNFIELMFHFYKWLTWNDFKTSLKVLMYPILKK